MTDAITQLLDAAIAHRQFPGAVVRIDCGGATLVEVARGHAHAYNDGVPIDTPEPMLAGHVFDLASITKAFATTLAAMLLVDAGTLDLNAPVAHYLPGFVGGDKAALCVHHLLSHTSGFAAWMPLQYHVRQRGELPAFLGALPLRTAPGTERVYSDLGYIVLGFVIEAVAREPLDVLLQRRLFAPLGLRRTCFNPLQHGVGPLVPTSFGNAYEYQMISDPAFGYPCSERVEDFTGWRQYTLRGEVMDGNAYHALGGVSGHAGLFSCAAELQALGQLVLARGVHGGVRYFSESTWDAFVAPRPAPFGWVSRQGMASLEPFGGDALPPCTVGAYGFSGTFVLLDPTANLSVILLTNRLQVPRGADGLYPNIKPLFAQVLARARDT